MMRTLIIGSGFVGRALAERITDLGGDAVLASRRPPGEPAGPGGPVAWTPLDVTDRDACIRTVAETGADTIVLVHGPSDVTWCEQHPAEALRGHATAAEHIAHAADGRRTVLISTDNVFDGTEPSPHEDTPTHPANGYGRAKLAAERILTQQADTTVLRVSLIYGWEPAGSEKWLNFFASCAHRLRSGQPVEVPFDQWTTPVLLDDVTAVAAAVAAAPAPPALLHLGGPDRISRADWAAVIAEYLGVEPDLVVPVPRAAGRYADRPRNTCLSSTLLADDPCTAAIRIRGVREGTRALLEQRTPTSAHPVPGAAR
jgi:dTDP-4-dehydrorhamnose reductase